MDTNIAKIEQAKQLILDVTKLNNKLQGIINEGSSYDSIRFYYSDLDKHIDVQLLDVYDDDVDYEKYFNLETQKIDVNKESVEIYLSVNTVKKMKNLIDNFIAIDFEPLPSWEDI